MDKELDKAQEALGHARAMLATLDYTTERVNHIKFERSSDGIWWFRITAERLYLREGLRTEDDKQVIAGRKDSALSLLLRVYGDKLSDFGKGIK